MRVAHDDSYQSAEIWRNVPIKLAIIQTSEQNGDDFPSKRRFGDASMPHNEFHVENTVLVMSFWMPPDSERQGVRLKSPPSTRRRKNRIENKPVVEEHLWKSGRRIAENTAAFLVHCGSANRDGIDASSFGVNSMLAASYRGRKQRTAKYTKPDHNKDEMVINRLYSVIKFRLYRPDKSPSVAGTGTVLGIFDLGMPHPISAVSSSLMMRRCWP